MLVFHSLVLLRQQVLFLLNVLLLWAYVTFTVFSEFEPMKSENTIKSRFEKSITSDFTDLADEIFEDTMAEEYVCSAAGKED